MATRKKKQDAAPTVDIPRCIDCKGGEFEPGESQGLCRLYPMNWVLEDDMLQAAHRPAVAEGYCLQFVRRVH